MKNQRYSFCTWYQLMWNKLFLFSLFFSPVHIALGKLLLRFHLYIFSLLTFFVNRNCMRKRKSNFIMQSTFHKKYFWIKSNSKILCEGWFTINRIRMINGARVTLSCFLEYILFIKHTKSKEEKHVVTMFVKKLTFHHLHVLYTYELFIQTAWSVFYVHV